MVIAEVIHHYQEQLLAVVKCREYIFLEQVRTHQRAFFPVGHPIHVVASDELGKSGIGFSFLHLEHVVHGAVGLLEFQFPIDQLAVNLNPLIGSEGIVYLHA